MTPCRKLFYFSAFFIYMFFSCAGDRTGTKANPSSLIHYSELNFLKLEGIKVLDDRDKYPFVTIENINSTYKTINFWYSNDKHSEENYSYESGDNTWNFRESFMSDTGWVYMIKKVYKDKIVYLEYEEQTADLKPLGTVRIIKNNTRTSYYLEKSINVKLGSFDSSFLKKPIRGIVKDSTFLDKGNIRVIVKSKNTTDSFCYHIGDHSLNWWFTYKEFLDWNKISCK